MSVILNRASGEAGEFFIIVVPLAGIIIINTYCEKPPLYKGVISVLCVGIK